MAERVQMKTPIGRKGARQAELDLTFDLSKDIQEKKNVAAHHPEVFERMKKELQDIIDAGRSRP